MHGTVVLFCGAKVLKSVTDHFVQEEKLRCRCEECGGQDNKQFTQKTEISCWVCWVLGVVLSSCRGWLLGCWLLLITIYFDTLNIFKFPPYLVIQLARFAGITTGEGDEAEWWSNKITTEVTFPVTTLDFQKR